MFESEEHIGGAAFNFAAVFIHGLSAQWLITKISDLANRLGALVVNKAGGVPAWTMDEWNSLPR